MEQKLYNIKMRAARGGNHKKGGLHVSGAERIVNEEKIKETVDVLIERALNHSIAKADFLNISIEAIDNKEIKYIRSLPITTIKTDNFLQGRQDLIKLLVKLNLPLSTAHHLIELLVSAPPLRGAMLIDVHSLKRLENNLERGIRVTGMDWHEEINGQLSTLLDKHDLNNCHVKEAVALASKVANAPGIIAEICWSDDPHYTAGYLGSKKLGYVRFTHLKPKGLAKGGRIFCFDSRQASLEACFEWLENQIILINEVSPYLGMFPIEEYLKDCCIWK